MGRHFSSKGLPHPNNFRSSPPELGVRWIDVSATGKAAGFGLIDWDGQESADVLRADFVADHGDVKKMFAVAEEEVRNTLMVCPQNVRAHAEESALCNMPGVSCNPNWLITIIVQIIHP